MNCFKKPPKDTRNHGIIISRMEDLEPPPLKRDDNKVETGGATERVLGGSARSDPNTSVLLSPSFLLNPHLFLGSGASH
ncbi:hypothetical protein NC651_017851 [Populus alba x Populus x berolinensis]|nr:hypothetical protein NC651_017851 [Populus alba x Populus x berolinensis]